MFERVSNLGTNQPWISMLFLFVVTALLAPGLDKLQVGTDFTRLIADSDPDKQIYRKVAAEFGSDNRTLVYVRDANLWSVEKLAALERLHLALDALPFVARTQSIYSMRTVRAKGEKLDSRLILPGAPVDAAEVRQAREDALYTPLIRDHFLSEDANATTLIVSVKEGHGDSAYAEAIQAGLAAALEPYRGQFDEIFEVGSPRIETELNAALTQDLRILGPLSAALLLLTILLFLRTLVGAIVPMATSALSIVWTFGMMGWSGINVDLLIAMLPSLIIVIGSTEDTHLVATYLQAIRAGEVSTRGAATRLMMRKLGVPMLLTVLTTALGFASNAISPIGMIRDFALVATFGIVSNGIITWLLVPNLMRLLGPRGKRGRDGKAGNDAVARTLVGVFSFTHRHFPRGILVLTGALCAFFVYQASTLQVTNDPMSYFKDERQLLRDVGRVQDDVSGIRVFFVTLQTDSLKAFLEPHNLHKLERIQEFIGQQEVFDSSISVVDYLGFVNREFHGGDDKYFRIPTSRELVAQYLLFFHRNDLSAYLSADYQRANIVVRHSLSDSRTLNRNIAELKQAVREIAGDGFRAFVVGENLMINAAADKLLLGQVQSLGLLLLMIFLVMSLMFTSFKGGLIAMIPSLIPIALMFGIMGLLDIPLNPGTAMVAVIAIGIAVDGTVHLLSRYNELGRRTSDYDKALRETIAHESLPAVATALSLALGFGLLLFSQFSVVAQFGALSAATMLFSIFANLLITPLVMTRVRLVGLYDILAMSVPHEVLENSPLFQGMTRYEVRKSILISELNEFRAGELLMEQGSRERSMYLILEGQAEVTINEAAGEHKLAVLGPGEVLGEIGFVRATQRTANVRATSAIKALRYDFDSLGRDLRFFPGLVAKINFNISGILGERLARMLETGHGKDKGVAQADTGQEDDGGNG